jgi:hypothetical protein
MMHPLVKDVESCWRMVQDSGGIDPCGVLWRIGQHS